MKMVYRTVDGRITFEIDVANGKAAFEVVAKIDELFAPESCGCCGSEKTRHEVREYDGNKYYKRVCNECNAQLDYGQHKTGGTLFIKRWDRDEKQPLPNNGWYVWSRESNGQQTQQHGQQGFQRGGQHQGGQHQSSNQSQYDSAPF